MEEPLDINLLDISGSSLHISTKRSKSLRDVITENQLFRNQKNQPFCFFNGNLVHIDLTLASLNIQNGDTIIIVFKKDDIKKKITNLNFYDKRDKEKEKLEHEKYLENLRITDSQYNAYESSMNAQFFYQQLYKFQQEKDKEYSQKEEEISIPLVTDIPRQISEDPLPICWKRHGKKYK